MIGRTASIGRMSDRVRTSIQETVTVPITATASRTRSESEGWDSSDERGRLADRRRVRIEQVQGAEIGGPCDQGGIEGDNPDATRRPASRTRSKSKPAARGSAFQRAVPIATAPASR